MLATRSLAEGRDPGHGSIPKGIALASTAPLLEPAVVLYIENKMKSEAPDSTPSARAQSSMINSFGNLRLKSDKWIKGYPKEWSIRSIVSASFTEAKHLSSCATSGNWVRLSASMCITRLPAIKAAVEMFGQKNAGRTTVERGWRWKTSSSRAVPLRPK